MKQLMLVAITLLYFLPAHAIKFLPVKILSSCAMATDCTSNAIDISQFTAYAIQANFTGSPVGTLTLQISSDVVDTAAGANPGANVVNWSTYTGSSQAVSAEGNFIYNIIGAGYKWVRLSYSATSGSGSLSATFNGKD